MSWLDDMEAADPAYPDSDADPWVAPDYVPDTSRGLPAEVGNVIGEWARQQNARAAEPGPEGPSADGPADDPWAQPPGTTPHPPAPVQQGPAAAGAAQPPPAGRTFTLDEAYRVAEDAVGLFLEYRDTHGRPEADARIEAFGEVAQGLHAWADADEALSPHRTIGPDWRAQRAAQAQARDAGLRASAYARPGPHGALGRADAAGVRPWLGR